jgi:hypothetical protein
MHRDAPVLLLVAALLLLIGQAPVTAQISEDGSLLEFYSGSEPNCAYDNWVSHISEGIARAGYNEYAPVALDRQTNGFGHFQVISNDEAGDQLLAAWRSIFDAFLQGDAVTVQNLLDGAGLSNVYQIVSLTDGDKHYLILREVLNDQYTDDNGTVSASDDVVGSFDYGWGLFALSLDATRPNIILEVPHPCDDFIAPHVAMDALFTLDGGLLFVNGAGREVAWTGVAPYDNSKSLSDPSRNDRTVFQMAHQAAVDAIGNELVIQVHSYDSDSHLNSKTIEVSCKTDYNPNVPVIDNAGHFDLLSLTPQYPIASNSIGNADHAAVRVDSYYGLYYGGGYSWRGAIPISNYIEQPGETGNKQEVYTHIGHDNQNDPENWIHIEIDEFPNVITENILSYYEADGTVPTYHNFVNTVAYFKPFFTALKDQLDGPPAQAQPETMYPITETTSIGTRQGDLNLTANSDNAYEVLTEVVSGGSPNRRYSYLEHTWSFNFTGHDLTLNVEAFHNANNESDNFVLAGSKDGVNYTDLLTVTKTSGDNSPQSVAVNTQVTGTYYIRVRDTDRTAGRTSLDRFSVDYLAVSYTPGVLPREDTLLVHDITLTTGGNKTSTNATGVVTVYSELGNPIPSAQVSIAWSGLYSGNQSAQTDANGRATFTSGNVRNASGYFILTVTNVTKQDFGYVSAMNVETTDQIHVGNGGAGEGEGTAAPIAVLPTAVTLAPAYPNPFNSETHLMFGLPDAGHAKVQILDLSGRTIAILSNGDYTPGYHILSWDASNKPAGVYLVKLETKDLTAFGRVMLIR